MLKNMEDKIYTIEELPKWAKIQILSSGDREVVAIFEKVEWEVGKRIDEQWDILYFSWEFKRIDQDCFEMLNDI